MKKLLSLFLFVAVIALGANAQTGVKGKIVNDYGEPLVGATVHDKTSDKAVQTDFDGNFTLQLEAGQHQLEFIFVSYETIEKTVSVTAGKMVDLGNIVMTSSAIGINAVKIIADRAKERETPVAFTDVRRKDIDQQLGSRDIPLVMNVTPSVYATPQGGGSGDARINVRGFNQRNVAIMINGVPVNDMENGWVYWSNWDGLADATSSIQMQRGLSAVNLATPSIGGTMNIITSPAEHKAGGLVKMEYGSGEFYKTTLSGNTGLINNKFALSATIVRKVGSGVVDRTWTDAWAYYFGASYQINKKQRLELFALGAPQRHGQNLYRQNVAAYSTEFAKKIGANLAADGITQSDRGRLWNENWNYVDPSYTGKQWWNGKEHTRHSANYINERENYYHKPLVNLNWYSQWAPKVRQFTVLYYSGGKGGGSGTLGHMVWDYSQPSRIVNWDGTIAQNRRADTALGILRNSVNEQWTLGLLSRVNIHFSDKFKAAVGIDARTAEIQHFREVRDLLGGKFFYFTGNEFDSPSDYNKGLGDKVDYFFTNTVKWAGYFAQAEYSGDKFTAYGTFGNSYIKYTYTNHFKKGPDGGELKSETPYMMGYQIKGGVSYRPLKQVSVFANFGYISKQPIFDNVIDDRSGTTTDNPQNELFLAYEGGVNYKTLDKKYELSINFYNTTWMNRALNIAVQNQDGSEGFIFVHGMNELHQGVEVEAHARPTNFIGFGAIASFGNWLYLNDVSGAYKDYSNPNTDINYNFYVKGLRVGDAPQTQYTALLKVYPVKGLRFELDYRYYTNYFADWDPFSRTTPDRDQVWKVPDHQVFDGHISYDFKVGSKYSMTIFGHMFNIMNAMYVQDATDNSKYNAYPFGAKTHDANSAEVFLGLPRTFNVGLEFRF